MGGFPAQRPRRLRGSAAMRSLVAEHHLAPQRLVLPMFVKEGLASPSPITSMPGVVQHSRASLVDAVGEAVEAGVGGVMLFGVPSERDARGSAGTDPDGILNEALADVAAAVGESCVVMADTCLDEFTDHGHCGVLDAEGRVDNDATLVRYVDLALAQASAGASLLGLSGMMDGQVGAVRAALDAAGRTDVALLAYSAKYATAFYGPFREAVDSALKGDRRTYQMEPGNRSEALREVALDIDEGADAVMVKPALPYLDVLVDVVAAAGSRGVPTWAYQVSGEYAMVEAAAANGWIDRERAVLETLLAITRAGASTVLSYWAVEAATWLRRG